MKVVIDSSVLIGLASISQLHLITDVLEVEEVIIPAAVWREVVEEGQGRKGAKEVQAAEWISTETVDDQRLVKLLRTQLDAGEAEAISLAGETNADLVLLDEKEARETAKEMNLQVLGTVGILIKAKKASEINCLQKELDQLKTKANFRISKSLYRKALSEVGELS